MATGRFRSTTRRYLRATSHRDSSSTPALRGKSTTSRSGNYELFLYLLWPGGVVARALDLRLKRSRVRLPAVALSDNNLGQVVHTHLPLSPSSIIWYRRVLLRTRSTCCGEFFLVQSLARCSRWKYRVFLRYMNLLMTQAKASTSKPRSIRPVVLILVRETNRLTDRHRPQADPAHHVCGGKPFISGQGEGRSPGLAQWAESVVGFWGGAAS